MRKHPHALVHPFRLTLLAFIEELSQLEHTGLEPAQCQAVCDCLEAVIDHIKTAPQSEWLQDLLAPFVELRADYSKWNNAGDRGQRAQHLRRLRHHKNGILPRYNEYPLLASDAEHRAFFNAYDEFIKLGSIMSVGAQPKSPFKKTVARAREKQRDIA